MALFDFLGSKTGFWRLKTYFGVFSMDFGPKLLLGFQKRIFDPKKSKSAISTFINRFFSYYTQNSQKFVNFEFFKFLSYFEECRRPPKSKGSN